MVVGVGRIIAQARSDPDASSNEVEHLRPTLDLSQC
jgi:hypothetical protein